MRGGAIPVFAWGVLLLVLFIGNAIWDPHGVDPLAAGFGALMIFITGVLIVAWSGRRALRRGAPEVDPAPQAVPQASLGAVLAALGVASIAFGFTFGHFAVYFGAGLLAFGLGRLVVELRAERETRARVQSPPEGPARPERKGAA